MENGNQVTYTNLHKKGSAGYRTRYLQPTLVFRQLSAQSNNQTVFFLCTSPGCCPHLLPRLWRWVIVSLLSSGLSLRLYLRAQKGTVLPLLKPIPPRGAVIPDLAAIRLLPDGEGDKVRLHLPSSPQAAWKISGQVFC